MPTKPPTNRLKESVLKQALKAFSWDSFEPHLKTVHLDEESLSELFGHIRRNSDFLIKRPDTHREERRATLVERLTDHLANNVGPEAAAGLREQVSLIQRIESGYREILRTQEATPAARLLPEAQASAALVRAAHAYHELTHAFDSSLKQRRELMLQSFRIKRSDGSSYSPDAVLSHIVDTATMTLMLLAHRHNWFDSQKFLVLPKLPDLSQDEIEKAGLTELLAASWRHWERTEQRCRYFEGDLRVFAGDKLPSWAPQGAATAIEYTHVSDAELFDYIANERLDDRLLQIFQEMTLKTGMHDKAIGIAAPVSLPPGTFVSAQEAHADVALSEILGYAIVNDQERPCGLRLIEWVRGYAALQCLARERYAQQGKTGLRFVVSRETLVELFDRVGLKTGAAEAFIDQTSLRASSRDLFDQPLVRMQDGSLLVFGSAILNANLARVTLSAIGNQGQQLARKGKAFEEEMQRFFQKQGFQAKAFKFKQGGEEFEYDVLVPWDDHIFIFECKNLTLSGNHPVAAYNFVQEIDSATRQVTRLADALVRHADVVSERSGIAVAGKTVVPCVVNSLTYALPGDQDGVYVTDASALKRFFQERHFHLVSPYRVTDRATVLHRTAMKALWTGDKPTPADLMAYLRDPLQLQLMTAHTQPARYRFGLGETTVVAIADLALSEMSTTSIAEVFSVDAKRVEREAKAVTRAIQAAQKKHEWKSVREAERAWRLKQRRKPTKS